MLLCQTLRYFRFWNCKNSRSPLSPMLFMPMFMCAKVDLMSPERYLGPDSVMLLLTTVNLVRRSEPSGSMPSSPILLSSN